MNTFNIDTPNVLCNALGSGKDFERNEEEQVIICAVGVWVGALRVGSGAWVAHCGSKVGTAMGNTWTAATLLSSHPIHS